MGQRPSKSVRNNLLWMKLKSIWKQYEVIIQMESYSDTFPEPYSLNSHTGIRGLCSSC